jgi:uncharacterized membrane protein YeaQ/YmgE (transglycosylase-associated protein family)
MAQEEARPMMQWLTTTGYFLGGLLGIGLVAGVVGWLTVLRDAKMSWYGPYIAGIIGALAGGALAAWLFSTAFLFEPLGMIGGAVGAAGGIMYWRVAGQGK